MALSSSESEEVCKALRKFLAKQKGQSMLCSQLLNIGDAASFASHKPQLASRIGRGQGKVGTLKALCDRDERLQIDGAPGAERIRIVWSSSKAPPVKKVSLDKVRPASSQNDPDFSGEASPSFAAVVVERSLRYEFDETNVRAIYDAASGATTEDLSSRSPLVSGSMTCDRGYLGAAFFQSEREISTEDIDLNDPFKDIFERETTTTEDVFLNTSDPFCAVVTGVQGSGKSHTSNVILENCLLSCDLPHSMPLVKLARPTVALVLHYDESDQNVCESIGLRRSAFHPPSSSSSSSRRAANNPPPCVDRVVVLVSPTYYEQRKRFYSDDESIEVYPLLFRWPLSADQLKILMAIGTDTTAQPLYVSVVLNYLRRLQRADKMPSFQQFLDDVTALFKAPGQRDPLEQRLQLLQSFIAESDENTGFADRQKRLGELFSTAGALVVADLTDPMLSRADATNIFHILLVQFRQLSLPFGKVVAFDEAHKYLDAQDSGFAAAVVTTVRLMRHEGTRVLISTQSPLCLPSEIFELASIAILHCAHSSDWIHYLAKKIPITKEDIDRLRNLDCGEALLFATATDIPALSTGDESSSPPPLFTLRVRKRLTVDYGASRRN